ncbi:MAG: tetratricopeptide repeat protein [Planctomycetes bacterium]|nr:tetratricopeptide repeat protein [Planctomycetota bacterium]
MIVAAVLGPLLAWSPCGSLSTLPQGVDEVFTVRREAGVDGQRPRIFVAADRRQISCLDALRALAAAMNWNLAIESTPLQADLSYQSVDLNLADQDPRMVAQLIAVAGGADVILDEPAPIEGARATVHVLRVPDAATQSGRQRMRTISGQWYRSFLRDELEHDPLVTREAVKVRMNLGQLLVDSGDLESAIGFFTQVFDSRPHDYVAAAILKISRCHLDIARSQVDRRVQKENFEQAEKWARELLQRMPTAPEVADATILLGRALLGQAKAETNPELSRERADLCRAELSARVMRLVDSVGMLDVWLLVGEAQLLLGQSEPVYETMLTLRESSYFEELGDRQYRDYHFLLGYGALGTGRTELAMKSLEWFLIHAEDDSRRGIAHVLLAESYLALERLLQARAAAVECRRRYLGTLSPEWRQRALEVWARTALALGEKEGAFLELEQMIVRGEEPELALFLADQLLEDNQWERAISVIRGLLTLDSDIGDQARFKKVLALYEQAVASKHLDDFPPQAIALATRIKDSDLASRVAAMIGDAYTRLGKLEQAADAYRGILR